MESHDPGDNGTSGRAYFLILPDCSGTASQLNQVPAPSHPGSLTPWSNRTLPFYAHLCVTYCVL